ncbi:hypothetical protein HWV62_40854 [Athelia sp. TMB]|nr:hypothetical protein HWV62_40854 [Athelia sp. TMB]
MPTRDRDSRATSPLRRLVPVVTLTVPQPSPPSSPSCSPNSLAPNSASSDTDATAIGSGSGSSSSEGAKGRNRSLGASIRRKLQEARDSPIGRSISLRAPRSESSARRGRHGRALSSGSGTRPQVQAWHTDGSGSDPGHLLSTHVSTAFASASTSSAPTSSSSNHLQGRPAGKPRRKSMADVVVPELLQRGVPMTKISAKRQKTYVFQLDPDQGQILWVSKAQKIIPIENIKELRLAGDARFYREQFALAASYEARWLTIIYILDGSYKTLHLIAPTENIFALFSSTVEKLYAIRRELMSGLGHVALREAVWEKQYWKGADEGGDARLDFGEAERLCRRLNVAGGGETLQRLFQQVDTAGRGYLDFGQFQHFVRLLKARPEVDALYGSLTSNTRGVMDFEVFEAFMRGSQKAKAPQGALWKIFAKYATPPTQSTETVAPPPAPLTEPVPAPQTTPAPAAAAAPTIPATPAAEAASPPQPTSAAAPVLQVPAPASTGALPPDAGAYTLSAEGFSAFLLSNENSAFADQDGKTWHDMTRPLSQYYISTSHNTYLVGHQLVGVSTIEGYIRALLHSCRSVELDIYDGEKEPVIFHGKTLTTKVALSEVCHAIAKYAFVASPYPVIISAEIHCSLPQQDQLAATMSAIFGDTLVKAPIDGAAKVTVLPSPEALRGKILLKAKNLYVSASEVKKDQEAGGGGGDSELTETEETTSEASEAEAQGISVRMKEEWRAARETQGLAMKELKEGIKAEGVEALLGLKAKESEAIKNVKSELKNARESIIGRVKGRSRSPAPTRAPATQALASTPPKTASPSKMGGGEKPKMSMDIVGLLIYTVGVKCRGINKKETYAPEHVFSLSETTANKMLKHGMHDLIKHNRTHVVRIYPKGSRIDSTNYEPHRYWSAGAQLVAINWQTFDMGYTINHAMFQRNGRSGYVLKPLALRSPDKALLSKLTKHVLEVKIISAQQLPRLKDASGREIIDKATIDPFVEVSIHVPDWTHSPYLPSAEDQAAYTAPNAPTTSVTTIAASLPSESPSGSPGATPTAAPATNVNSSARAVTYRTGVVKNNGFNPLWQEDLHFPFDCVGEMMDLVFVKFTVRHDGRKDEDEPLAIYCASLGSLHQGYRHLPLHDAQLSQYLFSTLFVQINIRDV